MRYSPLIALIGAAEAAIQGFNYGSTFTNGQAKSQSDFEADFRRAQSLQGTSGFNSARLYTMIQGGTTNTPISAIPAAISTKTGLLLGLWASAGEDVFKNELAALQSAITQYGTSFTDLIQGISVGSEDLYRITPTGIENKSGVGAGPDVLVNYIQQLRSTISGTAAAGKPIGHVDTWTAWVNGSNSAVVSAIDWLGFDGYPYFQTVNSNGIENAKNLFQESLDATIGAAQGKDVWITETGWPVSGPKENLAVASTENAKRYWDEVGCSLFGSRNTWWYTLQDSAPTTPSPSFGIVGSDLNSAPLYDLSCGSAASSAVSSAVQSVASSAVASSAAQSAASSPVLVSPIATGTAAQPAGSSPVSASPIGTGTAAQPEGSSPVSASPIATGTAAAPPAEAVTTITVTTLLPLESCPAVCGNPPPPAPTTLATSPAATTPANTMPVASPVSNAPKPSGSSCPTNLNGQYEYPHLIVPVDSTKPDTALGTSYNGTLSSTVSTIFNFDIPASYSGKTCSLVFLFPQLDQLETSSYSFNGKGGISVSQLSDVATQQTSYSNVPAVSQSNVGSVASLQAGNGYVIDTFSCPAGEAIAFEFSSTGGLELNFFEDYNPSPLGAYVTVC